MEKVRTRKGIPKPKREGLMNVKKAPTHKSGTNAHDLSIELGWHKVDGTPIEDLEKYIYEYLGAQERHDVMEIMVGTDGLEYGVSKTSRMVKLLTVICFRKIGKGAHIIKRSDNMVYNRVIKTAEKLNMEVNKTFEIVSYLNSIGVKPIVHLDLNPNPEHESFNVYTTVKGWFESMGCTVEYKPDSPAASFAADFFL